MGKLLDEIGYKILQELQEDGRASFKDISEHVDITSPSVAERITKMEDQEIIYGFKPIINYNKLGYPLNILLPVSVPHSQQCLNAMRTLIEKIPEIIEVYELSNVNNFLLKIICDNTDKLSNIINEINLIGKTQDVSIILSNYHNKNLIKPIDLRDDI